ncbi:MAG: UDP-glucose 4-epimerase GalE [Oscillospiraceae bacterium]
MILVTGGLGFIGSHTVVELINKNKKVVIIDNLYNSDISVLENIEKITNVRPVFYNIDVLNYIDLNKVFVENKISAVIHFAGYKAVGESIDKPLMYYENNLMSTINLLKVMEKNKVNKFIFSSSATVYGKPEYLPYDEKHPTGSTTNPYGETKLMSERVLRDYAKSNENFKCIILRYFNPIGAHESGLIGENPKGIPNNLMPYINKVVLGELDCLGVFGDDYDTKDGTGVRDYIHVVDLANGHLCALDNIDNIDNIDYYNLGTGIGYSVLDIIKSYEKLINKKIKYKIKPRRAGDVSTSFADIKKSEKILGFKAIYNIEDMCKDSYNFIKSKNNSD